MKKTSKTNKVRQRTRRGVFAVVLDGKNNVLVVRRVLNWRGWELPKGGCDGKTERETLEEELWEEVGLAKKDYKVIRKSKAVLEFKFGKKYGKKHSYTHARFTGWLVKSKTRRVSLKHNVVQEHDAFKWVTWKEAMKLFKFSNQVQTMKEIAKEFNL